MQAITPTTTLEQPFSPVKSNVKTMLTKPPDSMIHHKHPLLPSKIIVSYRSINSGRPYGVSSSYRVLSKGLLLKRFDEIVSCLRDVVALPTGEREATLRLLRFWAYYGEVYPKASQVCSEPGCSKATFWRAVAYLKNLGLIDVIPRFVVRPHAQISNLYRLDKLVLVIARYLAEHGQAFYEKWLTPYLVMPGRLFWGSLATCQESRVGPLIPASADL